MGARKKRRRVRSSADRDRDARRYQKTRRGTFEKRLLHCVCGARSRASARGMEFAISTVDFPPQTNCPLLPHNVFDFNSGDRNNPTSMSIDRIDSSRGYTPDNCWLISNRANKIKYNATFEEFETIYLNWRAELIRRGEL